MFFNFYFPKETDKTEYTDNRFSFFEFENFNQKYIYHYRVDFENKGQEFEKTNQKLYEKLNDEQSEKLTESIGNWKNQNGFKNWEISLLTESSIERNLEYKKFMLSFDGEKKFGFINIETKEIKFAIFDSQPKKQCVFSRNKRYTHVQIGLKPEIYWY